MSDIEVLGLAHPDPLAHPALFRELSHRYLVWDAFVAGQRRVDLHPIVLSEELHGSAVRAAEDVVRATGRAAARAHTDRDERDRYGLSADVHTLAAASFSAGDQARLSRVDLLLDETGTWRACEINADCPGGHNEAAGLPRLARAAGHVEDVDPTNVLAPLVARLAELAVSREGERRAVGLLFATAYAEDLQICAFLKRALEARGVRAVMTPPTAPRRRDGALMFGGTKLGALYRYFPTEYMDGQKNLGDIAEAVARGEVRTMASFSEIYAQSKLAMARSWALRATLPPEDTRAIEVHVPESHDLAEMSPDDLRADRAGWVIKKALGRVGDEVFVGALFDDAEWARAVLETTRLAMLGETWIAQRFVRQRPIPTPWGPRLVTLGAYVLDGRFAGYFSRVTQDSHVSHDALCLPVFVRPTPGARMVTSAERAA